MKAFLSNAETMNLIRALEAARETARRKSGKYKGGNLVVQVSIVDGIVSAECVPRGPSLLDGLEVASPKSPKLTGSSSSS